MVGKYLGGSSFINNAASDAVSHRFCHGIAIHYISKHIYRGINRCSCEAYIGSIRQRVVQILGKAVTALYSLIGNGHILFHIRLRTMGFVGYADDVGSI